MTKMETEAVRFYRFQLPLHENLLLSPLSFPASASTTLQAKGELLLKNGAIDGYAYAYHVLDRSDVHCVGPWHYRDFCKIFLPNLREDKKKSYHLRAGAPRHCAIW